MNYPTNKGEHALRLLATMMSSRSTGKKTRQSRGDGGVTECSDEHAPHGMEKVFLGVN